MSEQICKCDDCGYEAPHDQLPEAKDILQRLDLNGPFTDVECPECGALCYLIEEKKAPEPDPGPTKSATMTVDITLRVPVAMDVPALTIDWPTGFRIKVDDPETGTSHQALVEGYTTIYCEENEHTNEP
jgi:hypothetical protein